jgi:hypothetical protein
MKKNIENQQKDTNAGSNSRRGFLKAASLLGLGTMAGGPVISYASGQLGIEREKGIGTILTKKRTLGSKKNPLEVSAIQLRLHGNDQWSWCPP